MAFPHPSSQTQQDVYHDRAQAGRALAHELLDYRARAPLVVAIFRGGVPVGAAVAAELGCPLEVLVVGHLAVPGHEELALGAMADGDAPIVNQDLVASFGVTHGILEHLVMKEQAEIRRRERTLRGGRPPAEISGRIVLLVDDGVVSGITMRAAVAAMRVRAAREVIVAVPVAAREALAVIQQEADAVICPVQAERVVSLARFYSDFGTVSSVVAERILTRAARSNAGSNAFDVRISAGAGTIGGELRVPRGARGVIAFAHGSGSGRFSPRNGAVARQLEDAGFATLLVDLLTAEEQAVDSETQELRFDIPLLAARMTAVIDFLEREPHTAALPVGIFGASTGAAAALSAAAARPERVLAVVARGGRPDLAEESLERVLAPTLLIVGSEDPDVLELNRAAARRLRCPNRIEVIQGATHLFQEAGALERAAQLAADFYLRHLVTHE